MQSRLIYDHALSSFRVYYCCIIVITAILLYFKFVLIRQEHDRCCVVYFYYHFLFRSFSCPFLQVLLSSSTLLLVISRVLHQFCRIFITNVIICIIHLIPDCNVRVRILNCFDTSYLVEMVLSKTSFCRHYIIIIIVIIIVSPGTQTAKGARL